MSIVALHGFLGEPKDFLPLGLDCHAPKLNLWPLSSFDDWAEGFNAAVSDKIVFGYSLGGRLLLHALIKKPQKACIILAAHPGLEPKKRASRLFEDRVWAHRFRHEPWPQVVHSWNQQAIFANSKSLKRLENDFSKEELALCLENFSLGKQADLRPHINQLSMPILWIAPKSEEEKVAGLNLRQPLSKILLTDGSHRLLFDDPQAIAQVIKDFLCSVS